ncbi:MAG: hypothetical protein AB8E82_11905 [Aureispira sp.]
MNNLLAIVLLFTIIACTKQQELNTTPETLTAKTSAQADVVYYYKEQAYPLYYKEGSAEDFVEDENFTNLQTVTAQSAIVTFTYGNEHDRHFYLFDNEMEGYDYLEQHGGNPLIGRKFKLSHRIDELRDKLQAQFGQSLDFKNPTVVQAARQGVEAIYQELQMNVPFPSNLETFIGIQTPNFSRQKSSSAVSSAPVLTVWEHADAQGSELYVDQAPNTVIWNYGDWNCFTMAANPDLTLEFQPNGNNWNDCISSQCLSYVQGADAMAVGLYKDSHFGVYPVGYRILYYLSNGPSDLPCFNHTSEYWYQPNGWTGHMNDQVSSIRIKAIWQGCYNGYDDFKDLQNL